jgi:hypothetical protein
LYLRYVEKIRKSIVPVLGSQNEQRPMEFEELKDLPMLQACFYEAVRVSVDIAAES